MSSSADQAPGDRVALITGGSRGIGLAIAQRLLADGARVCITARKAHELEAVAKDLGVGERLLTAVGKSDDAVHRATTVDEVVARFGRLDLLVNNAGTNPVFGSLMEIDGAAVDKILQVNLIACLGWAREFYRAWAGQHGGAVVNIASFSAVRPSPGIGMYGISTAALVQLTRQLAFELAPRVRVNAVIPALIGTELAAVLYECREEEVAATYPLGRIGRPADVSGAVAFLASEDAAWITGETLLIDGGLSLTGGVA
jgi:3-oxoacyl-[acyl-carrier protein] reductase